MTKNSKSRRNRWADLWPKSRLNRGRHAADDTVVPIVAEPVSDVDYIGRHRAVENTCAPYTSDDGGSRSSDYSSDSGGTASCGGGGD